MRPARCRLPGGVTYARLAEVLNEHGAGAAQPGLAAAHLGGGRGRHRQPRLGRRQRQPGHGGDRRRAGHLDGRAARASPRGIRTSTGVVVGLGALGIVTGLTLAVEPYYEVSQHVFEGLSWEALFEHFDEITGAGDSVSVFHRFGDADRAGVGQARAPTGRARPCSRDELFGAPPAGAARHPIPGMDPVNATAQLGVPGPWSERLPHFRSGFTPSSGEEIQSEFFVARDDAVAAIEALRGLAEQIRPLLLVAELRTIAADELWLSPHYRPRRRWGSTSPGGARSRRWSACCGQIEAALAPFAPRPHWGKLFTAPAPTRSPHATSGWTTSARLRRRLDPRGAFGNDWLRRRVLGDP